MDNRRRSRRFTVVDLDLFLYPEETHIGQVINVSEGGLLAYVEQDFNRDKTYQFNIPFNRTINGQVNFEFEAEVVWCTTNALDPNKFSLGLKFAKNAALQTHFIMQMIQVFGDGKPD